MPGFLTGVLWGGIATAAGLAIVSELTLTGEVRAAVGAEAPAVVAAEPASEPVQQVVAEPAPVMPVAPPEPEVAEQPEAVADLPTVAPIPSDEAMVVATPEAAETALPAGPDDPLMNPATAEAPPAAVASADSGEPAVAAVGDVPADPAPATEEPVVAAIVEPAEAAPSSPPVAVIAEPAAAPLAVDPAPDAPVVASNADQPGSETPPLPLETPVVTDVTPAPAEPAEPPVVAPRSLPQVTAEVPVAEPDSMAQPVVDSDTPENFILNDDPSTLAPVPGFKKVLPGVVANRLPRIGTDVAADDAEVAAAVDQPPMVRFASDFENPDQRPVFSIILLDSGLSEADRAQVAGLPFPVTVALDPLAPTTPAASAAYRAAGREVVMLASGIPTGAEATDVAVTFQNNADVLPESVAVLDLEQNGFQGNRPLATLVVPAIKDQGRAVITWDQGLNAGDQVARREGVASGMVFRRMDGAGTDIAGIRRSLDKAAFKAGQDGRVIVVADAGPETLAALMVWVLEGRGADVAIAPVTAALTIPQ